MTQYTMSSIVCIVPDEKKPVERHPYPWRGGMGMILQGYADGDTVFPTTKPLAA